MARSAPSLRQASHFSGVPAVTMTRAPNALPSWIAVVPIPDEPPCTSSVSPAASLPRSNTLCQTGGFDHRQTWRHRQRVAGKSQAIFGVTAADHERHHFVALVPPRHAGADLYD